MNHFTTKQGVLFYNYTIEVEKTTNLRELETSCKYDTRFVYIMNTTITKRISKDGKMPEE